MSVLLMSARQTQNLVVVSMLVLWFARQLGLNEAASAVVPRSVCLKWSHLLMEWWLDVDRDIVLVLVLSGGGCSPPLSPPSLLPTTVPTQ